MEDKKAEENQVNGKNLPQLRASSEKLGWEESPVFINQRLSNIDLSTFIEDFIKQLSTFVGDTFPKITEIVLADVEKKKPAVKKPVATDERVKSEYKASVMSFQGANSLVETLSKGFQGFNQSALQGVETTSALFQAAQEGCSQIGAISTVLNDGITASNKMTQDSINSTVNAAGEGVSKTTEASNKAMGKMEKASAILQIIQIAFAIVSEIMQFHDKQNEKKIKSEEKNINVLKKKYTTLGNEIKKTFDNDVYNKINEQNDNLEDQKKAISEQIRLEEDKKNTDKDRILDWQDKQTQLDQQIADNNQKRMEMLAGTNVQGAIDTLGNALVEAYARGEDGAKAMGETTKKVLANAVKEALKKQFLGKAMDDAVTNLSKYMEGGVLTDDEKNLFAQQVKNAGTAYMEGLKAYDDLFKGDMADAASGMKGEISASITEVTASLLEGHIRAMLDRVAEIRSNSNLQVDELKNGFVSVKGILESTKKIEINTGRSADGVDSLNVVATEMKGYLCEIRNNTQSRFYK